MNKKLMVNNDFPVFLQEKFLGVLLTITETGNACQADDGNCWNFAIHSERLPTPPLFSDFNFTFQVKVLSCIFTVAHMSTALNYLFFYYTLFNLFATIFVRLFLLGKLGMTLQVLTNCYSSLSMNILVSKIDAKTDCYKNARPHCFDADRFSKQIKCHGYNNNKITL